MIRKSAQRFSEKIMLNQKPGAPARPGGEYRPARGVCVLRSFATPWENNHVESFIADAACSGVTCFGVVCGAVRFDLGRLVVRGLDVGGPDVGRISAATTDR